MQKELEWKAGKDFLLFKKDEIAALHTQQQGKVNICVFTETQATCLNLYLKQLAVDDPAKKLSECSGILCQANVPAAQCADLK